MEIIQTVSDSEIQFISELDYGEEAEKHAAALKEVIFNQNGIITENQFWHPYEVIELGSNCLIKDHEREFVICTLLIILNVKNGKDISTEINRKLSDHSDEYDKLPNKLRDLVLQEYEKIGC